MRSSQAAERTGGDRVRAAAPVPQAEGAAAPGAGSAAVPGAEGTTAPQADADVALSAASSPAPAEATTPDPLTAEAVGERVAAGARWLRWRKQLIELLRFGTVGGIAFVVDVGLMNLLRFGPGEVLGDKPLTAKVISVCVATLVAWIGNRYWTFAERKRSSPTRELVMFVLVNAGGMLVAVGTLAVSHYVLGFTSPLADNIAANGVGLALGTVFRYVCYRYVVFTGDSAATKPPV